MSSLAPPYAGFLGTWLLIPQTCVYQQGPAPLAGRTTIAARDGALVIAMTWTAADGFEHRAELVARPDGVAAAFVGGDAIDALALAVVSPRELRATGTWRGARRMVSQRQLDATGQAMRVTQVVWFDDGTQLADVAVHRRHVPS